MPLHIEITGECSERELEAAALAVAALRGDEAALLQVVRHERQGNAPTSIPAPAPMARPSGNTAPATTATPSPDIGQDADRPKSEALMAEEVARVGDGPPPPPTVNATADTDANGIPWDVRIHAGTKAKLKDGTWKKKRGIDDALVTKVEDELKRVMNAGSSDMDPAAAFPAASPEPTAPPPPAAKEEPAAPPPPATAAQSGAEDFSLLMKEIVAKQTAGTLSTELPAQIAQQLGLTGVADLMKRPDLIPSFKAALPA